MHLSHRAVACLRATLLMVVLFLAQTKLCGAKFDSSRFETDKVRIVLGIDLHDETDVEVGIVVRDEVVPMPRAVHLTLPFSTFTAEENEAVISTWGASDSLTYVWLILPGTGREYYSVGLKPTINYNADQIDSRGGSISLITEGQVKTFIYKYLPNGQFRNSMSEFFQKTSDRGSKRVYRGSY